MFQAKQINVYRTAMIWNVEAGAVNHFHPLSEKVPEGRNFVMTCEANMIFQHLPLRGGGISYIL